MMASGLAWLLHLLLLGSQALTLLDAFKLLTPKDQACPQNTSLVTIPP